MCNVSISTVNLSVGYHRSTDTSSRAGSVRAVQSDLNLTFYEGETVALLGPNGSGKSTLLRTLAGLQPPVAGDCNLLSLTPHELAQRLALVLTENNSVENTSVHDVIAMGRYPYTSFLGGLGDRDEQIITEALRMVCGSGTADEADDSLSMERMFNALSDGEKQRVLIAKAIAQQTPVILLDEPTAHLDLPSRIRTFRLLRELAHERKKTVLVSTHELDLALQTADRVLLLSKQNIPPRLDTVENLIADDAFTAAFGMDVFSAVKPMENEKERQLLSKKL